jgi:hypothetical protein
LAPEFPSVQLRSAAGSEVIHRVEQSPKRITGTANGKTAAGNSSPARR